MQWHEIWHRIVIMTIPIRVSYLILILSIIINIQAVHKSSKMNVRRGMYIWHLVLSCALLMLGVSTVLGILDPRHNAYFFMWITPTLLFSLALPAQIHLWRTKFLDRAIRKKMAEETGIAE